MRTAQDNFALDSNFALIEGRPPIFHSKHSTPKWIKVVMGHVTLVILGEDVFQLLRRFLVGNPCTIHAMWTNRECFTAFALYHSPC